MKKIWEKTGFKIIIGVHSKYLQGWEIAEGCKIKEQLIQLMND